MEQSLTTDSQATDRPWWRAEDDPHAPDCASMLRPGDTCPQCDEGLLAYNGLFQLVCRRCKAIAEPGAFT